MWKFTCRIATAVRDSYSVTRSQDLGVNHLYEVIHVHIRHPRGSRRCLLTLQFWIIELFIICECLLIVRRLSLNSTMRTTYICKLYCIHFNNRHTCWHDHNLPSNDRSIDWCLTARQQLVPVQFVPVCPRDRELEQPVLAVDKDSHRGTMLPHFRYKINII